MCRISKIERMFNMKNFDEEKLREEYTPKKHTGLDEAKKLDKKAKFPAYMFTYTFGVVGALILGIGMCLSMQVIASGVGMIVLGVILGILGIAMISANYPIYKHILMVRKEKYASQIILALNQDKCE